MKPGRNDPCPCDSGKKYKKCCADKFQLGVVGLDLPKKALAPTQVELNQLIGLFNARLYTELESRTRLLVEEHPTSGFVWKFLSAALLAQGKDALFAMQQATKYLPDDAEAHYNLGNVLKEFGKLEGALASYRRVLAIKSDFAETHCNMGIVLRDLGQPDDAVASYRLALKIKPDYYKVHSNLGLALHDLEQFEEAAASCRLALEIKPDYAEAHNNLGLALNGLGQLEHAQASYRRALEIKPDLAEAIYNLGNVLKDLGQFQEAAEYYRRVLGIKPDYVKAYLGLGLVQKDLELFVDAGESFLRALEIEPGLAEAHNNLGNVLSDLGRFSEAAGCIRQALEIEPDFAVAHNNLGNVLRDLGQFNEAAESYRQALELKSDFAEAHSNLGNTLRDLGHFQEAAASYRRALQIKPDFSMAHSNLGNVLRDFGLIDEAVASYRRAMEIKPDYAEANSNLLFALHNIRHEPSYHLEQARQFGRRVTGKVGARFLSWNCTPRPERLRVGLVSGDLWKHPVGFFLEGLLTHIDQQRIELFAYPTQHKEDDLTARIRPCFSAWKPLAGKNDEAAAHLIHGDGVHVLFDLSGHTAHNRLPVFAWKPAPVQVTWLGFPTTTGVAEMDYVLGDPHAIPAEFDNHFSETVWRMPESYLCLTVPAAPLEVAPLPAISAGYVTFGCFNNLTKLSDATVVVWARILKSVPNSRLLLKTSQLKDSDVCEKTRQRFAFCGIEPDRLILSATQLSAEDHLAMYNKVDIALDTFPYPGVTTSVEALWMGVPVLSLRGDRFLSRTAGSIAHNAGLPDWVAADEDDYVDKAVAFTSNLESLAALRVGLRQQVLASPLFDAPRFARNFEDTLWGMWGNRQA